jgi:signal recognition particle subunit SEC65
MSKVALVDLITAIHKRATELGVKRLHFFGLKLAPELAPVSPLIFSRDSAVIYDSYDKELRAKRDGRRWPRGQAEKKEAVESFLKAASDMGLSFRGALMTTDSGKSYAIKLANYETEGCRRCLILGCSKMKIDTVDLVPAIKRYDGPPFRVLRKFLRDAPEDARNVDVFILSAKYGLIDGDKKIGIYDQVMTLSRAKELKEDVERQIRDLVAPHHYRSVFLSMGKTYLQTLDNIDNLIDQETKIITSNSGSGRKLTELKNWLWIQTD